MKKMMRINNESGFTLVGVLAVFTIISVFGISLVMLSITSVKTSNTEHDDQSVFYIAEAGANYMVNEIEQEVYDIYDSNNNLTEEDFFNKLSNTLSRKETTYDNFEKVNGELPIASISITPFTDEKQRSYKVTSKGTIHDQERTVEKTITIDWPEEEESEEGIGDLPPFAVFIKGGDNESYDLQNGATIIGDIGIISDKKGGIQLQDDAKVIGNIYVPDGNSNIIESEDYMDNIHIKTIDPSYTIPELPPFPNFPKGLTKLPDQEYIHTEWNKTDLIKNNKLLIVNYMTDNYILDMKEDLEFKEIKIKENNTLYIDTGNEDRAIVVKKLNIKNGHIKLKGTGKLTLYVKDEINMDNASSINKNEDINRVNIFYEDDDELELDGDQVIYGSIYAKEAEIDLQDGAAIYGNVFSGGEEISLQGGSHASAQLILAPRAKVEIQDGGSVKGMIVSRKFEMEDGGSVTFDEPFVLDGPISPAALGKQNPGNGGNSGGSDSNGINSGPNISTSPIKELDD